MTYPPQPARSGMPPWAKWTMIGCAGCLTLAILGMVGCSALIYQILGKNMKLIDMSDKLDPPLNATAGQLLPPRVGSFARKKWTRYTPQLGSMTLPSVWKGYYFSGSKRVELEVKQTAGARMGRSRQSPFGSPPRSRNPNMGVHMTMKMGGTTMDIVSWAKPNWSFTVQSPDMVAEPFARAYQPR